MSFPAADPSITHNSRFGFRYSTLQSYSLVAVGFPKGVGEPFESFVQTVSGGGASGLDELLLLDMVVYDGEGTYPSTTGQTLQTKLLGDLGGTHGVLKSSSACGSRGAAERKGAYRQILLVGENKEKSITKFILIQHALQLFPSLDNTVAIIAINDENDTLGVLEVMSPERTNLVLTTDIPYGELNVLVLDRLDVEA